jgi:predicted MFS family arabinose efflux permease
VSIDVSPLRVRNFRILLFSQTTSVFGDGLTTVAIAFAVLATTGSVSDVGLVLSVRLIPVVCLVLLGGALADRRRRERVMALSQLASFVCQATLAGLLLTGAARLWMMLVLYFGLGCAQAAFRPASSGLVPQLVAKRGLTAANGLLAIGASAGQILGPAVGGVVTAAGSPGLAIAIDAATFLVSSVLLMLLRPTGQPERAKKVSVLRDVLDGWAVVRSRTWIWAMIIYFSVFQFAVLGGLFVLGPAVARAELGGANAWGALLAASGVGALAGGALATRWQPKRMLVGANLVVLGVVPIFVLLAIAAHVFLAIVAMVLYGASLTYGGALWDSTLQANVAQAELSRVASFDWLGSLALRPIGLALAGPVAALIGLSSELWAIAAVVVCGSLILISVPSIRATCIQESAEPAGTFAAEPT